MTKLTKILPPKFLIKVLQLQDEGRINRQTATALLKAYIDFNLKKQNEV